MKKLFLLTLVFAFMLSACGGVKATVANNPYAKESQAIVEKWIAAGKNRDAQALLSLYSNDLTWRECSGTVCESYNLSDLKYYVLQDWKEPGFKIEIHSYFVTTMGRFAVIQATFSQPSQGLLNATATAILEIVDGKILNETWYMVAP